MTWAEEKAREMMSDPVTRESMVVLGPRATATVVERAIRETIAKCAEIASACAVERTSQLNHLLAESPADSRHVMVAAKGSEAERIADAIRKLATP